MAQLLHLCPSASDDQAIEDIARDCNIRIKHAASARQCLEWLELWSFDGLIVRLGYGLDELSSLTEQLWSKNPAAPFWAYDFGEANSATQADLKLMGGSVLLGSSGKDELRLKLATLKMHSSVDAAFRVMVVEDLDSPRDIICFFIEKMGYKVEGFSSATEAIERLANQPNDFDCIITDYRMPRVNGEEFIKSVRARPEIQNKPIIVLTAYGTVDSLVACLKAGASGFLLKPPKRADLRRELGRAMRICDGQLNPRLSNNQEADSLREILIDKGFI